MAAGSGGGGRRIPSAGRAWPALDALNADVPSGNQLLASLSPAALVRLRPHLHPEWLERKQILFRAHEPLAVVYFPTSAIVSLVAHLQSGETLEVGLVGRDGIAGTVLCRGMTTMTCDGIVQVPGAALRMNAGALGRELADDASIAALMGAYTQLLMVRCMQMSLCNMFHTVDQRCIRWLLAVDDLLGGAECIPLTHELLATMLGVRRPTVTLTLASLQRARLLNETRGRIVILDRGRLEAACCECYGTMRDEQRRLLGY
jgi:CRP-like cAMP-binding protein